MMHLRTFSWPRAELAFLGLLLLAGCATKTPPRSDGKPTAAGVHDTAHGHSHERGKMLIADAGPYHALLTAHLSAKQGNELDICFETPDPNAKPVPLPLEFVMAQATTGVGDAQEIKFEPAPMEERKGDPAGKCSHFVAKAPWMKPADMLLVVAR